HDLPPTYLYTLSLHDALPISSEDLDTLVLKMAHLRDRCLDNVIFPALSSVPFLAPQLPFLLPRNHTGTPFRHDITPREERMAVRSEEHTSELQSLTNLVCRLL